MQHEEAVARPSIADLSFVSFRALRPNSCVPFDRSVAGESRCAAWQQAAQITECHGRQVANLWEGEALFGGRGRPEADAKRVAWERLPQF